MKLCVRVVALMLLLSMAAIAQTPKPSPAPARFRPLLGEYVHENQTIIVLESDGKLYAVAKGAQHDAMRGVSVNAFSHNQLKLDNLVYTRKPLGPEEGATQLKVTPLRPVPELIKEARAAQPPQETGDFLPSDLVELTKLDPTIKLDIRYATTNNLFGTVFYSQPRAFLQRAPAEALVRVNRKLKELGYGLLVHDGYRPWYVTKVFWDATPDDKKIFVADPSKGSRHNRGAAVDLTLYDLKTGKPIEMVSTYDETTDRAHPDYPGGTSLQRWHRDLLRSAMEAEGFTVYAAEWWHFDYKDWQRYRIGNETFESHKEAQKSGVNSSIKGPCLRMLTVRCLQLCTHLRYRAKQSETSGAELSVDVNSHLIGSAGTRIAEISNVPFCDVRSCLVSSPHGPKSSNRDFLNDQRSEATTIFE